MPSCCTAESRDYGIDLVGPTRPDVKWQAKPQMGFEASQFHLDWQAEQATCPEGHTSISWTPAIDNRKTEVIKIKFSIKDCQRCPSRSLCTHSTRYPRRTITVRREQQHRALHRARARTKTEEFKTLYARRAGVEGTISEASTGDGPTTFSLHWSRKDASWEKNMRERLQEAIELRSTGHAEEARSILLSLVAAYPADAEINYQTAWVHDLLGREREAVPFYVRAIEQGLSGIDLEGALLGLGSTYRTVGAYQQAEETLRRGITTFPHNRAFQVFLAMTLYNLHQYQEAMELLLTNLAETSSDDTILQYKRAILFYAQQLDQTWNGE